MEYEKHLSPEINKRLADQEELGTINMHKLKPNTIVRVTTKNSVYEIKVLDDKGNVKIKGGKHFPSVIEAKFAGSTFGGSMIQIGHIGISMHMEIYFNNKRMLSSAVKSIVISKI